MNEGFDRLSSAYAGRRVLVLGAGGFIGRWVARQLCQCGADLTLVVRDAARAAAIFQQFEIKGNIVEQDLGKLSEIECLITDAKPSICFNLAGYGIDRTERDENTAYRVNSELVEAVAHGLAKHRDRHWQGPGMVHVGTVMEYGAVSGNLAEESQGRPTSTYGQSKLAGTLALSRCCREHGLSGVTARLFAIYGPGESSARLLPLLIDTAESGKLLQLTAGRQKRDFVYVEDASEALLRLGIARAAPGEIVNVATGRLHSVRQFVEAAAEVLGIPQRNLVFGTLPTRNDELVHGPVTNARLRGLVGWTPTTNIVDGIRRTVEFQSQIPT